MRIPRERVCWTLVVALLALVAGGAWAQQAPAAKPKVEGWAAQRVMEKLDRGLVAMQNQQKQVYLGWRLLAADPKDVAFNVYRAPEGGAPEKLNAEPVSKTTDFVDAKPLAGKGVQYWVRPVVGGQEGELSEKASVANAGRDQAFISLKLQGDYTFQKVGLADLNGDGKYDYVVKQPRDNIDPYEKYWSRSPDTYKIEAYLNDGTFLWRYDLGWAIERGIWYSPYMVYDFDGDGKAEVACKTGEGDPRDPDGRVTKGQEYLTILDGMTGKEVTRVPWIARNEKIGNYNHNCRNQLAVAYLDGKTPFLLMERGTYELMVLEAYQLKNKKLEKVWHWDSDENGKLYYSQGAHYTQAADVDGDGRDEVIMGSCVIDDNGVGLWSTGLGHPDQAFVSDLDPSRPGMEISYFVERGQKERNGINMTDAKTGQVIWGHQGRTIHIHEGLCADIDPSLPGSESWGAEAGKADPKKQNYNGNFPRWFYDVKGNQLGSYYQVPPIVECMAWWDADLLREIPFKNGVYKYGTGLIEQNIDGTVQLCADIMGDWREEIITSQAGEVRVYTTTIPATDRRTCLMQDPKYRMDVADLTNAYLQPAYPSYYIGYTEPVAFDKSKDPFISPDAEKKPAGLSDKSGAKKAKGPKKAKKQ